MDVIEIVGLVVLAGLLLLWPVTTVWSGYDAHRRERPWAIALAVGFFWPLGLFAWLLLRPDLPEERRP